MRRKRVIIAAFIIVSILLFVIFDLHSYLTLTYIKGSADKFYAFYSGNRIITITAYFMFYIIITALSLPGAAVMTLAGGAIFGFFITLVTVSFASAIGATIACFVSRYILREWVEESFGDKLDMINEGMAKEGIFYLLMLRLIPVFPFFLINLLMGLTRIRLWTFYWVSQAGMLLGTAVYANAGKELGKIDSMSGIFSPGVIISFTILGIFPLAVKKFISFLKAR